MTCSDTYTSDRALSHLAQTLIEWQDVMLPLISKENSFKNPDYNLTLPEGRVDMREYSKQLEIEALTKYNELVKMGRGREALLTCITYGVWPVD